jgi:hypothetical protein
MFSMKKKGGSKGRTYLFGILMFFFLLGVARGILVYHDFFAGDDLDVLLWGLANSIILIGFLLLNYTIETYIYKKTKHLFTTLGLILTISYIIFIMLDKSIASLILYVVTALLVFPPMIIYLIVAKGSVGAVRKKAVIIMIGLFIIIISSLTGVFETVGIMDKITASIFGPPTALIGLMICGYGYTKFD